MLKPQALKALIVALAFCGASAGARANDLANDFEIGLNASTLGLGLEGSYKPWGWVGLRVGANMAAFETTTNSSSTDYKYDIDFKSAGVIIDAYPFSTGFRLSVGGRYNLNQIDYVARPDSCPSDQSDEECNTPQFVLEGATLASVKGRVSVRKFAPYVGFGYNGALIKSGNLRFMMDLGLLLQGDPKVSLAPSAASQSPVAPPGISFEQQERDIEQDLQWMKFFPVISASLAYRF